MAHCFNIQDAPHQDHGSEHLPGATIVVRFPCFDKIVLALRSQWNSQPLFNGTNTSTKWCVFFSNDFFIAVLDYLTNFYGSWEVADSVEDMSLNMLDISIRIAPTWFGCLG